MLQKCLQRNEFRNGNASYIPLHRRLYGCLRSSKQQFDIASSNPGCRLLNVGVCKKNWICKFFRDFCRLKRKI